MSETPDIYATKEELKQSTEYSLAAHNLHKHISKAIKEQEDLRSDLRNFINGMLENDVSTQKSIKRIIYENWKLFLTYAFPIIVSIINIVFLFIRI